MKIQHRHAKWLSGCSFIQIAAYANGRPAICLVSNIGKPLLTASVNIPEYKLADGYVLIKNWSENEGILKDLIDNNIVGPAEGLVPSGYVHAHICPIRIHN